MDRLAAPNNYTPAECIQLAGRFRASGDLSAALFYANKALETDPRDDLARFMLAAVHADVGLTGRAIREFRDLLQRRPDWGYARFRLGLLCFNAGRLDEASELFAKVATSEDPALACYGEALLALIAKDESQALERVKAGLAATQRDPEITTCMWTFAAKLLPSAPSQAAEGERTTAAALRGYNRAPKI